MQVGFVLVAVGLDRGLWTSGRLLSSASDETRRYLLTCIPVSFLSNRPGAPRAIGLTRRMGCYSVFSQREPRVSNTNSSGSDFASKGLSRVLTLA
jgi:hypothetical protein